MGKPLRPNIAEFATSLGTFTNLQVAFHKIVSIV